ncbi:MAG: DeoR/GlpR family DNA-binding transcription regulator [Capnocytophaga sp.]|nr:DeoR/GlpR family DNA-binding transcription regulator [Capnocytophaga sp.]
MKSINERQKKILELLDASGYLSVQDLSESMKVSLVTIRKDLNYLEESELLFRTHGGASKQARYAFEQNVHEKENIMVDEKKRIAEKAFEYVSNNDFIIMASGTTIHFLARIITGFSGLTVLTPSLRVGLELARESTVNTVHLGGELRKSSTSTVGAMAEKTLADFSCNKLFLGVDGIDLDFGISTSNASEAHLNQKMIEHSEKVIVLADSSKIGKRGFGRIAGIDQIDVLITDSQIDPHFVTRLEEKGVEVVVCK